MQLDELIDMLCQPQQDKQIKILDGADLVDFKVELHGSEVRLIPNTHKPF